MTVIDASGYTIGKSPSLFHLPSWVKKHINNFHFSFCVDHERHNNIKEICFIRMLLATYPSKRKGKVISSSQRDSCNWRWVGKLKVTDYPKQPASCTITACNLIKICLVKKNTMAKQNRQAPHNTTQILKVLWLTISLSVLQIWTARMFPSIFSLSRLAYKRCNTLSGASSERSKTWK